jgi:hypothetical protein
MVKEAPSLYDKEIKSVSEINFLRCYVRINHGWISLINVLCKLLKCCKDSKKFLMSRK